jgi:CBS domain-containing protein
MKQVKIKSIMVPLSQYATVGEDATLMEAVLALEEAQACFDQARYRHRSIIVLDHNNQVVGKISQLDALKALEPKYQEIQDAGSSGTYRHFSGLFLKKMHEQYRFFDSKLEELRRKAHQLKVKEFMHSPRDGETLSENATLDEALHMLIVGHHQSLLVTRGERIIGILRLTDVFESVFHTMERAI